MVNQSKRSTLFNEENFKKIKITLYGSEALKAGFDISKNINGFDLKFNANQSLSENSDQAAKVSLSRSY